MAESNQGLYGGRRRRPRPRERPIGFKDREFMKESYSSGDSGRGGRGSTSHEGTTVTKTPIILAKPDTTETPKLLASPVTEGITLQSSQEPGIPVSPAAGKSAVVNSEASKSSRPPAEMYKAHVSTLQSKSQVKSPQNTDNLSSLKDVFTSSKKPIKMLDSMSNTVLYWTDAALEGLGDDKDFTVIGIIGMQGTGKSTIMSILADDSVLENKRNIFPVQTQDMKERAGHCTSGIDMYMTSEKVILLDAQPILSPSILEQSIYNERKVSTDYNSSHNTIEIQSLQIATFFFSVCHVVIVVEDWFTDPNLYRFLQCAEMLKPSPPTQDITDNDSNEFYPHIVFVQNKADPSLCEPTQILAANNSISAIMKHSKLKYKGGFSLSKSQLFPALNQCIPHDSEVNIFFLPVFTQDEKDEIHINEYNSDKHFETLPAYRGHPNHKLLVSTFRCMVLSMHKAPITRHVLTEKTWFYYASKTWDSLKKSPLVSEFNRLLS